MNAHRITALAALLLVGCATQYRAEVHGDPDYEFGKLTSIAIRPDTAELPENIAHNREIVLREVLAARCAKCAKCSPRGGRSARREGLRAY